LHAGIHAFQDRRKKKRNFRKLWQIKINAASRKEGIPYSMFMHKLKKARIELDRKILAQLAQDYPQAFTELVATIREVK
jgi:large subunit ribosomal protein L20